MGLWAWIMGKKPGIAQNTLVETASDSEHQPVNTKLPYLLVKYDYTTNAIYVQVGWPQTLHKNIICKDFCEVLASVETANLHDTIKQTIQMLCKARQDEVVGQELIQNLDNIISNTTNAVNDDISMYPNEVFNRREHQ